MKTLQKIVPSLTSVILVVIMSVIMRYTLFAADFTASSYDADGETVTITTEEDLEELFFLIEQENAFSSNTISRKSDIVIGSKKRQNVSSGPLQTIAMV